MAKKQNVQKRKARPKRSIANPGDDHELGLWIDKEPLRKHQNQYRQTIIHDPLQHKKPVSCAGRYRAGEQQTQEIQEVRSQRVAI